MFVFLAMTLGVCRVARADSLSPYVWFWPGVVSITLVYAFPASLLAAMIERPFLTAAGLKRNTLVFSLRANLLSTIAGIMLIPIGYPAFYAIGPFWCLAAFGVSCVVEIVYLRRFSHQRFTRGFIIAGNAVSSAVLMMIPTIAVAIKQGHPRLAWSLEPHQTWMTGSALAASVGVFLASFAWPTHGATEPAAECDIAASTPVEVLPEATPTGAGSYPTSTQG
jgi:hypothetical protein